ncbi:MAG: WecB/TagA/CpsF family glycosyltransferase [Patescibacteria group bacterium]|jgi:N-acetylglucosaminyldiphosphoundecaprenol N-acetyl-beta-D-mannosaminyltransferase
MSVRIDPLTKQAVHNLLDQWLQQTERKVIYTPNPEILVYAYYHKDYTACLNRSALNLPDGIGIVHCSKGKVPERVTGTDTMNYILNQSKKNNLTVGIVKKTTGLSSVAEIKQHLPDSEVITESGSFTKIPDVVLVSLGFPEQEYWIEQHYHQLKGSRIIMAVGGSIDHITGQQKRAPLLFQRLGLEWLWRVLWQPHRLNRIITAVLVFPYLHYTKQLFHV